MRWKLTLATAIVAAASTLAVATPAHASPDRDACSSTVMTYTRDLPTTTAMFWLIGSVGDYRYWHVYTYDTVETYSRSYVVRCSGPTIVSFTNLGPIPANDFRCEMASTLTYQWVGSRTHTVQSGQLTLIYTYHYWHVKKWVPSGWLGHWAYDRSEVVRCLN